MIPKYQKKVDDFIQEIRNELEILDSGEKIRYPGDYNQRTQYSAFEVQSFKLSQGKRFPIEATAVSIEVEIFHEYYDLDTYPNIPGLPINIDIWKKEAREKAGMPYGKFISNNLAYLISEYENNFRECLNSLKDEPLFIESENDVELIQALSLYYNQVLSDGGQLQIFYKDYIVLSRKIASKFIGAILILLEERLLFYKKNHPKRTGPNYGLKKGIIKSTPKDYSMQKLTTKQIALLIHYLRANHFIFEDNDSELGRRFADLTGKDPEDLRRLSNTYKEKFLPEAGDKKMEFGNAIKLIGFLEEIVSHIKADMNELGYIEQL